MFSSAMSRSNATRRRYLSGPYPHRDDLDAMPGEVLGDVLDMGRLLLSASFFGDFDDHDALGLFQKRQRIPNGTAGLTNVFPRDGNSTRRE